MKTRYGLVSNSSSSSCVIIGELCYIHQLKENDIKTGIFVTGKCLSNGTDIINVYTKEILEYIKSHSHYFYYCFKNAQRWSDSRDIKIEQNMVGKTMYSENSDQWSSDTLKQLQKEYPDED